MKNIKNKYTTIKKSRFDRTGEVNYPVRDQEYTENPHLSELKTLPACKAGKGRIQFMQTEKNLPERSHARNHHRPGDPHREDLG
jgi:hypothetical protein